MTALHSYSRTGPSILLAVVLGDHDASGHAHQDVTARGAAGFDPAGRLSFVGVRPRRANGESIAGALEQFRTQAGLVFQRTERAAQRLGEVLTELLPPRPNAGSVPTTRLTADFALLESLSQLVIVGFLGP